MLCHTYQNQVIEGHLGVGEQRSHLVMIYYSYLAQEKYEFRSLLLGNSKLYFVFIVLSIILCLLW